MNPPKIDSGIMLPPAQDYSILQEVVREYPGVLSSTAPLFHELHQETRNWPALLKELRAYALKNFLSMTTMHGESRRFRPSSIFSSKP